MSIKTLLKRVLKPSKAKIAGVITAAVLAVGVGLSINTLASSPGVSTPDCNDNAVIYCGASGVSQLVNKYTNGDSHNSTSSIHDIFNYFGLSASDVKNMPNDAYPGYVTKSGDVYLNNNDLLVATHAISGGRQNIAGSTAVHYGGTDFFVRPPSVSFLDNALSAMVIMKNGVFQGAVLNSCGNVVKATPKLPNYSILKQVKKAGGSYTGSVTVDPATTVNYKITVKSTGAVPVLNVNVRDSLPSNIVYVPGTLAKDGVHMVSSNATKFFAKGVEISKIKPGDQVVFTFDAVVGPNETAETCKVETLDNKGILTSKELPTKESNANVSTVCHHKPPTPMLTCTSLDVSAGTADSLGNTPYSFTATASASHAKITSYVFNFGDANHTKTVATNATSAVAAYTYAPGQYNPSVTVNGIGDNGHKFTNVTSAACGKHITISHNPVCTAPNGSTYPVGAPECTPVTTCAPPNPNCTPTTLTNTGPGEVVGLFGGASAIGGFGYRKFLSRRLSR